VDPPKSLTQPFSVTGLISTLCLFFFSEECCTHLSWLHLVRVSWISGFSSLQMGVSWKTLSKTITKAKKYLNYYFSHIQKMCYTVTGENQMAFTQFLPDGCCPSPSYLPNTSQKLTCLVTFPRFFWGINAKLVDSFLTLLLPP